MKKKIPKKITLAYLEKSAFKYLEKYSVTEYQLIRMLRSHGMAREIGDTQIEKRIITKYPRLSPKFIFLHSGYNFRNNEISAVIGLSQLRSLNKNNKTTSIVGTNNK